MYLLDPVLGDMGRGFYVDMECLPIYQELMALATIICPNQFEAQVLAGEDITSLASLKSVLRKLHARGTPNVIITSVDLPRSDVQSIGAQVDGGMILIGSSAKAGQDIQPWFIQFPELDDYFVGVGDLFSALTLGRYQEKTKDQARQRAPSATEKGRIVTSDLARAAELAVTTVQGVLQTTLQLNRDLALPANYQSLSEVDQRVEITRRRELRVVQSRQSIEHPSVIHRAHWIK